LSYARVTSRIPGHHSLLKRGRPRWLATFAVRELAIATEQAGPAAAVIALTGEVDLYTCPEFKQELLRVIDDGAMLVAVDLTTTTFVDSTALGVLLRGVERLRKKGGRLTVVCIDANMTKIFEVTGLDRVFSIYRTRDEALAPSPD
jgi:anti-sigma B factor antagonist